MKVGDKLVLLLVCSLILSGISVDGLSYDYDASIECLESPHKPQYGGGIVANPELNLGTKGWTTFGNATIETRTSNGGNNFIVAYDRDQPHSSFSQKFFLEKTKLYSLSAWLQVSDGSARVVATFKTPNGFEHAGWVDAKPRCWSMLKGGITVNASGPTELYFESNNTSVEIWADNISLQPFTEEEWTSHQYQSIEKARKSKVKIKAVDAEGKPLRNATLSIHQLKLSFPFGCAINKYILTNTAYQKWFTSKPFSVTVFDNEMKWYATESTRGKEDYSVPDAMVKFAKSHGIAVRGHNVFWDDPQFQPRWVKGLNSGDLQWAADKRLNSIVSRYRGQLIAWDVMNENLHFSFFESKLGRSASASIYQKVRRIDGTTPLFLNEYNTIEEPSDGKASPSAYLRKINEIKAVGVYPGIGLESHFNTPNIPYIRASIDKLGATGLPIWITELDVSKGPNQAWYLEQILREVRSHPSVKGIMIWAGWSPQGCSRMCLTDNNFRNLPAGTVVDKIIREWSHRSISGTTDGEGHFETSLFHGDYEVKVHHPTHEINNGSSVAAHSFKIEPTDQLEDTTLHVTVSA